MTTKFKRCVRLIIIKTNLYLVTITFVCAESVKLIIVICVFQYDSLMCRFSSSPRHLIITKYIYV